MYVYCETSFQLTSEMFEADLEKALLLSKLEYEEHKQVRAGWMVTTALEVEGLMFTIGARSELAHLLARSGQACLHSQKVSSLGLGHNLVLGPGFIP